MELIYRIVLIFMMGIFILFAYQKIIHTKFTKRASLLIITLFYTGYMFFSYNYIIEPIRTIIGTLLLGILIWLWHRTINWAGLTLAFLCGYFAWVVSLAISTPIIYFIFGTEPNQIYLYIALFMQALAYFTFYKIVPLKDGITSIHFPEVKGIIYAATGIVLAFWGGIHVAFNRVYEINLPLSITALASLIIIITAAIFFIITFTKQYRERQCEKSEIEKQQLEMEKQLQDFEQGHRVLKRHLAEMVLKEHKYKDVISSAGTALTLLTNGNIIKEVEKRDLDDANHVINEVTQEFEVDRLVETYRGIVLPGGWFVLRAYIVQIVNKCEQNEIFVHFKNNATTWDQIVVSSAKLVRLMGNLLDNAIKELKKTDTKEKELLIHFFDDENDHFSLAVSDTAHEFPIHILAKLGQRENSTNGTGDGYAEIFELLNETGASFFIKEQKEAGIATKTIQVVFDEKNRRIIQTSYRFDDLKEALAKTKFELK